MKRPVSRLILTTFLLLFTLWISPTFLAADERTPSAIAEIATSATAATSTSPASESQPDSSVTNVVVGVYVNQMPSMSLKENKFQLDFYLWLRWKGESPKSPLETFELVNGKIDSKQVITNEVRNGEHYAVVRVYATMVKFWDVHRFPFDNHNLEIEIEDGLHDQSELRYIADSVNSAVSPDFKAPGWNVAGGECETSTQTYKTNYGDVSLPKDAESSYSRFTYKTHLQRTGLAMVPKLFFSLWVALALAMLSFFIVPSEMSPRLGFAASSIFASVGAMYSISSNLPMTPDFTVAERVNVLTIGCVFIALSATLYSCQRFKKTGNLQASLNFDHWARLLIITGYIAGNILVLVL